MNRILHYLALFAGVLCLVCLASCSSGDDGGGEKPTPPPPEPEKPAVSYYQKLFCMQFTSTGCINCPMMSSALKTVIAEQPGRLAVAAFHMHYATYSDPMHLAITQTYFTKLKMSGLPSGFLNIRQAGKFTSDKSTIDKAITAELADNPAFCGVAIQSSYDPTTRGVSVTAKVTSNEARTFRYLILLVEDGIESWQYGSDEAVYVHNNVVRTVLSNNIYGERLNLGKELEAGVEATGTRTATLSEDWEPANMRVIVAALVSDDNGVTWVCNNATECKLGESVDYQIIEEQN